MINIISDNYAIKFNGEYGEFTSETDGKLHFNIQSCHQEYEPRGKVEVDIKSPLHSDKAKCGFFFKYLKSFTEVLLIQSY